MELTKAIVDCMQTLRRRLRDELDINIRLSQSDAINAMLLACLQSSQEETRELGSHLSELSGIHLPAPQLSEEQLIAKYTRYAGPLRG
ncbi:MAG: hypothetical protein CFE49_06740 [Pseudomonas sp. PGPPP3]|nr:MAG: hypothetical protein CFE49_06740 [Pseudomonas sp. PGPPP3]